MCIVIDTCTLSSVFNDNSAEHASFKPVREWIVEGKGKIVFGGTKYRRELITARRYFRLFLEFKKAGKTVEVDDAEVDLIQNKIECSVNDVRFNDAHIVAIALASGCVLICTNERDAIPYFKRAELYESCRDRPKLYTSDRNADLLTAVNIAEVCKPAGKLSRHLKDLFFA